MLDVSVMAAVSALQREETRGAHTRDFPSSGTSTACSTPSCGGAATECRF
ncbi:MAG: hypothetical protein ACLSHC_09205 [Bilophila wadsworthia]